MKWIGHDLLKQDGMTIKDLANILEPQGLSYRTIYAYLTRDNVGKGSLEIGAKIAKGMGRTLSEVYVEDDYILPVNDRKEHPKEASSASSKKDEIIYALVECIKNSTDGKTLSRAISLLGEGGFIKEAEICYECAIKLKSKRASDTTEVGSYE